MCEVFKDLYKEPKRLTNIMHLREDRDALGLALEYMVLWWALMRFDTHHEPTTKNGVKVKPSYQPEFFRNKISIYARHVKKPTLCRDVFQGSGADIFLTSRGFFSLSAIMFFLRA